MRASFRLAFAAAALIASTVGCRNPFCTTSDYAAGRGDAPQPLPPAQNAGTGTTPADATRAIAEADIVQLDNEQLRIYAMSKSGAVAIVDAATPGKLTLLGKSSLSGEPFEMYRRGDVLLTMSNRGTTGSGQVKDPLPPDEGFTIAAPDPTASALLVAVDVANPAAPKQVAAFKVPGEIADSRIVGDVLYLATYENASCYGCGKDKRTLVTTFDISNPLAPKQIDQVGFLGDGSGYKRSVVATKARFYVGGAVGAAATTADEGQIDVLDITDPGGHLVKGAHLTVPGPITSRWQMDEHEGVLRVVSQRGVLRTRNGEGAPSVDTFRIDSSASLARLGHASMTLPRQEALKTVRFDGARAFAITFAETDPLFTLDLSDPATPAQKGELVMPGWVFHLEPRGDRLLGLGLDRRDSTGNLDVSLFDVSDLANPSLVKRVSFGPSYGYTDQQITSGILAEDQDRIQKAFRIFSDGLIAVPYSGTYGNLGDSCQAANGGIQLLSWTPSSLTLHASVPLAGNPRRAVRRDSDAMRELIGISDSNVASFAIDDRDAPTPTANVVIGRCIPRTGNPTPIPQGQPPADSFPRDDYGDVYEGSSCY